MKKFSLCWASWVVLCLLSSALTLIVVPATLLHTDDNSFSSSNDWTGEQFSNYRGYLWSHGWPFEYLRREVGNGIPSKQNELHPDNFLFWIESERCSLPISWSSSVAWPLVNPTTSTQRCSVRAWALILDLLVAGSIVILSVALCERFCQTRFAYRYRLIDLAGFLVTIGLCMAWCVHHIKIHVTETKLVYEDRVLLPLNHLGATSFRGNDLKYQGPDWLRRLVGCPPHFLKMCYHVEHAVANPSEFSTSNYRELGKLRYLQSVRFTEALTPDFIAGLRPLPIFESLTWSERPYVPSRKSGKPWGPPSEQRHSIRVLANLPDLHSLKTLELGPLQVEARSVEHFGECASLETLQFTGSSLFINDLQPLAGMACLREVHVDILATERELNDFNRKQPEFELIWKRSHSQRELLSKRIDNWGGRSDSADVIDLSNCKLTSERLEHLKACLSKVTDLNVGKTQDKVVLWHLFDQCENLELLTFIQEDFDVDDCRKLLRKRSLADILILDSTFTVEEVAQIVDAGNDLKESELSIKILGPAMGGKRETILDYDFF